MHLKNSVLTIFIVFFCCSVLNAQYGPKSTYRFLNVPVSAKAAALGGNPVSIAFADPSQMHVNPAFLSPSSSSEVSISLARFLSEANMGFISGAWHLMDVGTFGAGLRFMNYGEFDRIDEYGLDNGTFNAADVALKIAYSRGVAENLRVGFAADFIHSYYDNFNSTGIGFSGGLFWELPENETSFGLSFVNLGSQLTRYDGVDENLPFDLRLGVSRKLMYLPLRVSLTAHNLHRWDMKTPNDNGKPAFFANLTRHLTVGGEFLFSDNFNFRVGYNHFLHEELKNDRRIDLVGFGFGFGLMYKGIGIEFSRNSYSKMGHLLQLGINTRI
jgi:hypothetical protein